MFDWFMPSLRCQHIWQRTGREWKLLRNLDSKAIGHTTEQECMKCGRIRYAKVEF